MKNGTDRGLHGPKRSNGADEAGRDGVRIDCVWTGPAGLGECPLWDHRANRLYWIDSTGRRLWCLDGDAAAPRDWDLPDVIGSIGLARDGGLVAGFASGFAFIDPTGAQAAVTWLGDPEADRPDTRLNDGKVDRQGRFWCGSMNRGFAAANGSLYRLDGDLTWHRMDGGFTVSNGIAFSPDGRRLYFSDSRVDRSFQYDLDPASGALSNRRPFIRTEAYEGRIDGATVDETGRYWGALFEGGAVGCFTPDGALARRIDLPVSCPTMCSFGGPDLDVLYVTSATFSMRARDRGQEPLAGGLFAIHGLGARGIAETPFAGGASRQDGPADRPRDSAMADPRA